MKKIYFASVLLMLVIGGCQSHYYKIDGNQVYLYLKNPEARTVELRCSFDGFKEHGARKVDDETWAVRVPLQTEFVYFYLVLMTLLGKIYLQVKGGDRIDINNIKDKLKNLAAFESIAYTRIQEDYSYDFASRLFNALGLNGAKIMIEKERLNGFKEYKEKIHTILQNLQNLTEMVNRLKQKEIIYIDLNSIQQDVTGIQNLNWPALDLANHLQFGTIESFSDKLNSLIVALNDLTNLNDALQEYSGSFHEAIAYMSQALELLEKHSLLVSDAAKKTTLTELFNDVKRICATASQFKDRSQRNPIRGKIQQFKKIYIYDFYIPAHEKYIGEKVAWDILETYPENEFFKKITLLSRVTSINDAGFRQKLVEWNELQQFRCLHAHLEDSLQNATRCQKCSFPVNYNYAQIPKTLNEIELELEILFEAYEKTVVKEIRAYRDNLQYLEGDSERRLIQKIINDQKLPDFLTAPMIQTFNKLFREIEVVTVDRDQILKTLFPGEEMSTIDEFRRRFLALVDDLKKNRQESEIRIKLK